MSLLQKAREYKEKAVSIAMNYNEVERKVREATNPDEAWGPHGSVMAEIAQATYRYDEFPDAMGMLWKRLLQDRKPQAWRRIYKSLLLLHHLICNGSERVVESARDHLYDIRRLESFQYIDPKGKDQGINVSQKSKEICRLLNDDEDLRDARKKAIVNKDKYIGVGNPSYNSPSSPDRSSGRRGFDDEWDAQTKSTSGRKAYSDNPGRDDSDYDFGRASRGGRIGSSEPEDSFANGGSSHSPVSAADDDDDFSPRGPSATAQAAPVSSLLDLSPERPAAAAADSGGWGAFESTSSAPAPVVVAPPAASNDFGAFSSAAAPSAAPAASAGFGDFNSFQSAAPAAAGKGFGDFAAASSGGFGTMATPVAPVQNNTANNNMLGGLMMAAPAASAAPSVTNGNSAASLMSGGDLLGTSTTPTTTAAPVAAKPAAAPTANNTWSGLAINLDGLSVSGGKDAKPVTKRQESGTSVYCGLVASCCRMRGLVSANVVVVGLYRRGSVSACGAGFCSGCVGLGCGLRTALTDVAVRDVRATESVVGSVE
eukprot:m.187745 g.187745  ORF g.187745 m.187745 type:complete len:540 (+) comp18509_c0_seq1:223-1842(+)